MATRAKPARKQPSTQHAVRYEYLCESFLLYLERHLPGFKSLSDEMRRRLGQMIFEAPSRYRAHSHVEGHARYSYIELERWFRRGGFNAINSRLDVFSVARDDQDRPAWSAVKGHTRAFKLTPHVADLRERFLLGCWRRSTRLLTQDGKYLESLPASAVVARNSATNQARHGFKEVNIRPDVPVNLVRLKELVRDIEARLYAREAGIVQHEIFSKLPAPRFLHEIAQEARMLVTIANNERFPGTVPHRYQEALSGRLYAIGKPNLQSCFRVVRQAALAGRYDVDIENAHYTILAQMALQLGHRCEEIEHYLANKKQVRRALVAEFGISEDQAKQALIALIYGARLSKRPEDALPEIFKSTALAAKVYAHPTFQALHADIGKARAKVLKAQPINNRGYMKNCRGHGIEVAKSDARQQLAHILQGVESLALEAACSLYPADIVLLQHDGFSATRPLDTERIEAAMLAATGYRLKVEQKVIQVDLAEPFDKHAEEDLDTAHAPLPDLDGPKMPDTEFLNAGSHLGQLSPHPM